MHLSASSTNKPSLCQHGIHALPKKAIISSHSAINSGMTSYSDLSQPLCVPSFTIAFSATPDLLPVTRLGGKNDAAARCNVSPLPLHLCLEQSMSLGSEPAVRRSAWQRAGGRLQSDAGARWTRARGRGASALRAARAAGSRPAPRPGAWGWTPAESACTSAGHPSTHGGR